MILALLLKIFLVLEHLSFHGVAYKLVSLKYLNNYNLFIISDYNKFSLTSNVLKKIIKILRDKNKYIAIDTKKKDITSLKGINLLKCNLEEAKNIFDLDKNNNLNVKNLKTIQKKLQKYNINEVVITLGDQG